MRRPCPAAASGGLHRIQQVKKRGDSLIGVVHLYQCRRHGLLRFKRLIYKDYACLTGIKVMFVFGIGQKAKRTRLAGLYTRYGRHCNIGIPNDLTPEMLRYLFCIYLHYQYISLKNCAKKIIFFGLSAQNYYFCRDKGTWKGTESPFRHFSDSDKTYSR